MIFVLCACSQKTLIDVDDVAKTTQNTAELSDFSLISPTNGMIVDNVSSFSWNECSNAETYILEISSSDQFQSDLETVDYYKKENIVGTSFNINSSFAYKDTYYYWRVTAKNSLHTKLCSEIHNFYIKAPEVEEVQFDLGEADDWLLHNLGSYADIGIDNSNFFGNNEKSLKISFKEEDTNRGVPESDGWIVVTKVVEKSIYGTDALYFNCFYAGQDANVILRLVDRDNEYWYCPIQLSFNAQQSVILRFSDFIQRTADVTVANETFDFERIKYMEVVFEKSFGDGVFLLSNVKAIKFSNYRYMFIDKLNFSEYDSTQYTFENYNFETAVNDDYELELAYYGTNGDGKAKINGYGFAKIAVNKYMFMGDSIKLSIKYAGVKGTNALIRIYEEDTDRWSYKIPFNSLTENEYSTLIIPFAAFAKSQVTGDGKRQFYYIFNIQFGLEGEYSTGKLYFKDFEVVNKKDYVENDARIVESDGLVENFDSYDFACDMYRIWITSEENKDEYMQLNNTIKVGSTNAYSGQFQYKADMSPALYYLPVDIDGSFTSLSLWLKDGSTKLNDPKTNHLDNVNPDIVIYIRLVTGELYAYEIKSLSNIWYEYDIPFTGFILTNEDDLKAPARDIETFAITHIGISMQYFYYDQNGRPMPLYANDNPVYIDNIYFNNYSDYHRIIKEKVISMVDNIAMIENAEDYSNNNELNYFWNDGTTYSYQHKELSDNVASNGGQHSLKLQYKLNDNSPNYYITPVFDKTVVARAFKISLQSEKEATVYINFYATIGSNVTQYRATLSSISSSWTEYIVGFANLTNITGGSSSLTSSNLVYITRISIGVVYWGGSDYSLSNIYVDNLAFDGSQTSYSVMSKTTIE